MFNEHAKRCQAKNNKGGQCKNPAMGDSDFCNRHQKPRQHLQVNKWDECPMALALKNPGEQSLLVSVLEKIEANFTLNDSSDWIQAQVAAFCFVKLIQGVGDDIFEMQKHYDTMLRQNLSSLKLTREKREGTEVKFCAPADWAADLLAEVSKRGEDKDSGVGANKDGDGRKSEKKVAEDGVIGLVSNGNNEI